LSNAENKNKKVEAVTAFEKFNSVYLKGIAVRGEFVVFNQQ
jgi:hypothetical protein